MAFARIMNPSTGLGTEEEIKQKKRELIGEKRCQKLILD